MRAIVLNSILSGFRSRKDRSLGFSASTGELDTREKVALMELEGLNVRLLIEPTDYATDGKVEVKSDLSTKPPSQRLRAVLFVLFKQLTAKGKIEVTTFDQFYLQNMERLITDIKSQLDPEP